MARYDLLGNLLDTGGANSSGTQAPPDLLQQVPNIRRRSQSSLLGELGVIPSIDNSLLSSGTDGGRNTRSISPTFTDNTNGRNIPPIPQRTNNTSANSSSYVNPNLIFQQDSPSTQQSLVGTDGQPFLPRGGASSGQTAGDGITLGGTSPYSQTNRSLFNYYNQFQPKQNVTSRNNRNNSVNSYDKGGTDFLSVGNRGSALKDYLLGDIVPSTNPLQAIFNNRGQQPQAQQTPTGNNVYDKVYVSPQGIPANINNGGAPVVEPDGTPSYLVGGASPVDRPPTPQVPQALPQALPSNAPNTAPQNNSLDDGITLNFLDNLDLSQYDNRGNPLPQAQVPQPQSSPYYTQTITGSAGILDNTIAPQLPQARPIGSNDYPDGFQPIDVIPSDAPPPERNFSPKTPPPPERTFLQNFLGDKNNPGYLRAGLGTLQTLGGLYSAYNQAQLGRRQLKQQRRIYNNSVDNTEKDASRRARNQAESSRMTPEQKAAFIERQKVSYGRI